MSVLLSEFLFISMPLFIAKDYHTYVYIFELLVLLSFIKYLKVKNIIYRYFFLLVSVFFMVLLFLTKQNIGLIFIAGIFTLFLIFAIINKGKNYFWIDLIFYIFFLTAVSLIIFSMINFDYKIITNNDSKGNIFTI